MVACNREQCISALGIRGAMPVAGSRNRYIINAGQQELGVGDSAFLDWDIVVENQLPGTIEFQLVFHRATSAALLTLTLQ